MQTVAQKKTEGKTGGGPPLFRDCISKIKLIQIHLSPEGKAITSSRWTGLMLHYAHPFATYSWLKKVFCHNF